MADCVGFRPFDQFSLFNFVVRSPVSHIDTYAVPILVISTTALYLDAYVQSIFKIKMRTPLKVTTIERKIKVHCLSAIVLTAFSFICSEAFLAMDPKIEAFPILFGATFVITTVKLIHIYSSINSKNINQIVHFAADTSGGEGISSPDFDAHENLPPLHLEMIKSKSPEEFRMILWQQCLALLQTDQQIEVISELIEDKSLHIDNKHENGHTLLSTAIFKGLEKEFIEELLKYGFKIWSCDPYWTKEIINELIKDKKGDDKIKNKKELLSLILNEKYAETFPDKRELKQLHFYAMECLIKKYLVNKKKEIFRVQKKITKRTQSLQKQRVDSKRKILESSIEKYNKKQSDLKNEFETCICEMDSWLKAIDGKYEQKLPEFIMCLVEKCRGGYIEYKSHISAIINYFLESDSKKTYKKRVLSNLLELTIDRFKTFQEIRPWICLFCNLNLMITKFQLARYLRKEYPTSRLKAYADLISQKPKTPLEHQHIDRRESPTVRDSLLRFEEKKEEEKEVYF